jgi:hypothetical protein
MYPDWAIRTSRFALSTPNRAATTPRFCSTARSAQACSDRCSVSETGNSSPSLSSSEYGSPVSSVSASPATARARLEAITPAAAAAAVTA